MKAGGTAEYDDSDMKAQCSRRMGRYRQYIAKFIRILPRGRDQRARQRVTPVGRGAESAALNDDVPERQLSLEKNMSQQTVKMAEGQDVGPEEGPEDETMNICQHWDDEGR